MSRFTVGHGARKIFVLSQLLPEAPAPAFFASALSAFGDEFEFTVADCLEGSRPDEQLAARVKYWNREISAGPWEAFIGFSFGGCILQHLAHQELFESRRFLYVSSCTHLTPRLKARLERLLELFRNGHANDAVAQLDAWVAPSHLLDDAAPAANATLSASARARMASGFAMLLQHDARLKARLRHAPALFLAGSHSELIREEEISVKSPHRLWIVPGAGMRVMPYLDKMAAHQVARFLKEGA